MRSTWLAVAALACAVALTSACSSSSPGGAPPPAGGSPGASPAAAKDAALAAMVPANIRTSGVTRVAMDETYPPFESVTSGGAVAGLDPDLAQAIGAVLGVKVEFVNTSFDAIIPALAAGKVDMAMSSIGDTKARQQAVDFATYYWNGTLVLVKKGNPKGIRADMACGDRVGVIRGSLQQNTFLPAQAPKCQAAGKPAPVVEAYQAGPQAQLALQSGRIDGVMEDAPPVEQVADQEPQLFQAVGPLVKNPNPGGVAFPKGSGLLQPARDAINKLIADGTYAKILKKWHLSAIAIGTSQINGALS